MGLLTIDQLIFKGTHNSYVCNTGFWGSMTPPVMNHPPPQQVKDFGVWVLELDIGVVLESGQPRISVGHSDVGDFSCWGRYLTNYLISIKKLIDDFKTTFGFPHRPVFFTLDLKDWSARDAAETMRLAIAEFAAVFSSDGLVILADCKARLGRWPTIMELAGKAVVGAPPQIGDVFDGCTTRTEVEVRIANRPDKTQFGHLRIDQYQADWTFEYGVPPCPLFVDGTAQPPWRITDGEGSAWTCDNGDRWPGQLVHEQGSDRFPFKTLIGAVDRAAGVTPSTLHGDPQRAGVGWTILIRPGAYPEQININTPVTLKKDPRYLGEVIIGKRPQKI